MIHHSLVAKYPAESSYIVTGEACIHFTILTKLAIHQVKLTFNTCHLEAIWIQLYKHISCHIALCSFQESFDITHYGIEYLSFMEPVAIKLCKLVLPVELPFGEYMFLQCMVRLENDHRSCSFKTYAS